MERTSELDSMINEEECEVDLLSSSDNGIRTVSENLLRKRKEFTASERPEILITKDLIAGDDDEVIDS